VSRHSLADRCNRRGPVLTSWHAVVSSRLEWSKKSRSAFNGQLSVRRTQDRMPGRTIMARGSVLSWASAAVAPGRTPMPNQCSQCAKMWIAFALISCGNGDNKAPLPAATQSSAASSGMSSLTATALSVSGSTSQPMTPSSTSAASGIGSNTGEAASGSSAPASASSSPSASGAPSSSETVPSSTPVTASVAIDAGIPAPTSAPTAGFPEDNPAPCTASQTVNARATAMGSGPHQVVVETNSDPGIVEGTIFRPEDLGGEEKYPIFVWGQGACSHDGLANAAAMAEIASHGYFVVADGIPNGEGGRGMDRSQLAAMGAPLIAYVDWAIAENSKPCSVYYHALDVTKIAANGFSCGGLMAQGTVSDPRIVTWGVTSSGMAGADQAFYDSIHTPVLFVEGGTGDVAYAGALEGYEKTSATGVPALWFSKDLGHGGDLLQPDGGDFTKLNLAWLNWWLKGDESETGKGLLVGPGCPYCSDVAWDVRSSNLP
jgi:dienelactone hydrolase